MVMSAPKDSIPLTFTRRGDTCTAPLPPDLPLAHRWALDRCRFCLPAPAALGRGLLLCGRRRMEITVSASYGDPAEEVKAALQEAVDQFPAILQDPAPEIRLCGYGGSGVSYLIRAWTATGDYWDTYYQLLEAILPAFRRRGISMPYPQMDVHVIPDGTPAQN